MIPEEILFEDGQEEDGDGDDFDNIPDEKLPVPNELPSKLRLVEDNDLLREIAVAKVLNGERANRDLPEIEEEEEEEEEVSEEESSEDNFTIESEG